MLFSHTTHTEICADKLDSPSQALEAIQDNGYTYICEHHKPIAIVLSMEMFKKLYRQAQDTIRNNLDRYSQY